MSTWLMLLPTELNEMDESEIVEPMTSVEDGEKQVGTLSIELRKLYTLFMSTEMAAKRYMVDAEYARTGKVRRESILISIEMQRKADVLRDIFWIGIYDQFNLWEAEVRDDITVGVRQGFKVVIAPVPQMNPNAQAIPLRDFLQMLTELGSQSSQPPYNEEDYEE